MPVADTPALDAADRLRAALATHAEPTLTAPELGVLCTYASLLWRRQHEAPVRQVPKGERPAFIRHYALFLSFLRLAVTEGERTRLREALRERYASL